MKKPSFIHFGETLPEYSVPVLNEREVRAAAGILFLFASFSFFSAMFLGNFFPIRVFMVAFFVDFVIRLFINPQYAPSMIAGRFFVRKQKPEYVGAPQKKFAWWIGLGMTAVVIAATLGGIPFIGPICILCIFCLIFLFFESAFGICIGCWLYNLLHKDKAQLCPGGVCETMKEEPIQKFTVVHAVILVVFLIFVTLFAIFLKKNASIIGISCSASQPLMPSNSTNSQSTFDNGAHPCLLKVN